MICLIPVKCHFSKQYGQRLYGIDSFVLMWYHISTLNRCKRNFTYPACRLPLKPTVCRCIIYFAAYVMENI